jgi:hypothetical protein
MRRLTLGIILVLFALGAAACEFSASTARITQVVMARGYADGAAVDATNTFQPTDTIHGVVTLGNAPDDTKLKAVWTAIDAGDGQYKNTKIDETEVTTGGVADFTLSNTTPWPTGTYQVELYLNDTLAQTVAFNVQ